MRRLTIPSVKLKGFFHFTCIHLNWISFWEQSNQKHICLAEDCKPRDCATKFLFNYVNLTMHHHRFCMLFVSPQDIQLKARRSHVISKLGKSELKRILHRKHIHLFCVKFWPVYFVKSIFWMSYWTVLSHRRHPSKIRPELVTYDSPLFAGQSHWERLMRLCLP